MSLPFYTFLGRSKSYLKSFDGYRLIALPDVKMITLLPMIAHILKPLPTLYIVINC